MKNGMLRWLMVAVGFWMVACDDGKDDTQDGGLEIAGEYMDDYGDTITIDEESWVTVFPPLEAGGDYTTVTATVLYWEADEEYLITDNGDGTFGRYDWTMVGGDVYFCNIEYMADSEEAAQANDSADRATPAQSGCGDFPWSKITRVE